MHRPPVLISQRGVPTVPASDRLEEAVLWNYVFTFEGGQDVTFEVTYNEERTVSYSIALQDADGLAEIAVTASSGVLPLVLIPEMKLVATGGAYRYFTSDDAPLTFTDASEIAIRTVVLARLDVLDVQSARVAIREVSFPEPLVPFLDRRDRIDAGTTAATIAAHLTSLLHTLLAHSPFASQPMSMECRYGYVIGGVPVEAPVVLVTRQDVAISFDEELIHQIAGSIQQWLDAVQPPATGARLIFTPTFWTAVPRIEAPLLRLADVSVPMSAVTPMTAIAR